ncbi:MAG: EF-P lysine aminoacylase EpmA [Pseudomonadota bacterium]
MQNWQPNTTLETLRLRAQMFMQVREFFLERGLLEVETPLLDRYTVTDPNIESFEVMIGDEKYYLQTSPEYAMKRLIASGSPDIYQICKSFRKSEKGPLHNPEFTMLEWYRKTFSLQEIMQEAANLICLLVTRLDQPSYISYEQACMQVMDLSLSELTHEKLKSIASEHGLQIQQSFSKDQLLDFVFTRCVTKTFDKNSLTIVYQYPSSQAVLAKITQDNPQTAERFEIFCGELELANGYVELTDHKEQLDRFQTDLDIRKQRKLPEIDVDYRLIVAQQHGLPDCAGVAVGLDRVLMLIINSSDIKDSISFSF